MTKRKRAANLILGKRKFQNSNIFYIFYLKFLKVHKLKPFKVQSVINQERDLFKYLNFDEEKIDRV